MTENPRLGPRFRDALGFAFDLHRKQERKGGDIPYVSHLMAVACLVLEHGGDEDEGIAALLHDAVEDQGGLPTLVQIRERFGERVAEIVFGLSDSVTDVRSNIDDKADWWLRKARYIAHLKTASPSVRLVSAADKLHNCRALVSDLRREGESVWNRFNAPKQDQLKFYRQFYSTLADVGQNDLVDELAASLLDLEELAVRGGVAKVS